MFNKMSDNDRDEGKFISIVENNGRVELYVRGTFGNPMDSTRELIALQQASEQYDTVVVWINSPGGDVSLLVEMMNILKGFNNIITIGTGQIASAGAMLWSIGDVRVLMDYTDIMIHRESYYYGYAKTQEHFEHASHTNRLYTKMIGELFGDMLSDKEIEKAKLTEVFFVPEDLFERGAAITYEQFKKYDTIEATSRSLVVMDDITFIDNQDGTLTMLEDIQLGSTAKSSEVQYVLLREIELSEFEQSLNDIQEIKEVKPKKSKKRKNKGEVK
jgi:ATP-dependent protease ClpP protease subunit